MAVILLHLALILLLSQALSFSLPRGFFGGGFGSGFLRSLAGSLLRSAGLGLGFVGCDVLRARFALGIVQTGRGCLGDGGTAGPQELGFILGYNARVDKSSLGTGWGPRRFQCCHKWNVY